MLFQCPNTLQKQTLGIAPYYSFQSDAAVVSVLVHNAGDWFSVSWTGVIFKTLFFYA